MITCSIITVSAYSEETLQEKKTLNIWCRFLTRGETEDGWSDRQRDEGGRGRIRRQREFISHNLPLDGGQTLCSRPE